LSEMDTRTRRLPLLPALGLVVMSALIILPATRWLVVQQFSMVFSPPAAMRTLLSDLGVKDDIAQGGKSSADSDAEQNVVSRHSDDLGLQIAFAETNSGPADQTVIRLRALVPHFPESPALNATVLRYMCMSQVKVDRDEEYLFTGDKPPNRPAGARVRVSDAYDTFDQLAAKGERLDPDNGFFPAIRAIGLFGRNMDIDGLAALDRASGKPRFEEYLSLEARGRWRLSEGAYGRRGAFSKIAVYAAILFPHYAKLRSAVRMAMFLAVEAEKAGRKEEGLAIRHSLMKLGSLLRSEAQPGIGSLVGIALSAISMGRPGGEPMLKSNAGISGEQSAHQRIDRYCDYLERIGRPDEAKWVRSQAKADALAREIIKKGMDLSPMAGKPIANLMMHWGACILLLTDIFWLTLMAVLSLLLARTRAASGIIPVLVPMVLFAGLVAFTWNARATEMFATYGFVIDNLTSGSNSPPKFSLPPAVIRVVTVVAGLLVPLLVIIAGLVVKYSRKVSLSKALAATALPVVCLLVLLYCGEVVITMNQERKVDAGLDRMVQHEGPYLAEMLGRRWPGR